MERLSGALDRVLRAVERPDEIRHTDMVNETTITPIKLRWPHDKDVQSISRSLVMHDLTMLAVHAIVLQHGGRLITPNEEPPEPNHPSDQSTDQSINHPYQFVPDDWNSNQLLYSLSYMMYAPPAHHERETEHDPENAEVLTSETPIEYKLNVKAAPLNEFLIITMQMVHVIHTHHQHEHHEQNEPSSTIWPAVKTTLRCASFVDASKASEHINQSTDQTIKPMNIEVYHGLDKLMSAISNGLIKRSMGALWSVLVDRNSPGAHYDNPVLSDLPVDILISILSTLNSRELVRLGQASSTLYDITSLQALWEMLCSTEVKAVRDRQAIEPSSWKNEFIIRKQLIKDEMERNKYALVPVGQPVTIQREHVFPRRPVFRANFIDPSMNDPLGLSDWRRGGFRPVPTSHM